jgi:hypothetical protein
VQHSNTGASGDVPVRRSALIRWLVALPLLVGAALQLYAVALELGFRTDMSFDPVNVVIFLVPSLLYGLAATSLVGDRSQRLVWGVLLLCGAALTAVHLSYLVQYRDPGPLMLFPPYLTVVAMFELERRRRRRASDAAVQL